MLGITTT